MADPFAELAALLKGGVLGVDLIVRRGAATIATCRGLVRARDTRGDAGPVRVLQDVLEVEIAIADCTDLRKADTVTRGSEIWEIVEKPTRDELGLLWRAVAARSPT